MNDMLKEKIIRLTQFPYGKRKSNYQSYQLGDEEIDGARDTNKRMDIMNMPQDMEGLSVLDLGCNLGSICCESYKRGSNLVMGLDYEKDYIECAIDLAKYNNYDITYVQCDLTVIDQTSSIINDFFNNKSIDIVFALSLYKHIRGSLFDVLNNIPFNKCIIESNNAPQLLQTPHVQEMIKHIELKKWKWEHINTDNTRSPRVIFEVTN